MKRVVSLFLVLLMMMALTACNTESATLDEVKTYEIESRVHSLKVRINAADFVIKHTEKFSVESNLKYLSVSEKDGVLTIVDESPKTVSYKGPTLILSIPADVVFEKISIITGAAKLTSNTLNGKTVELQLGAGDVNIKSLNAENAADIVGGAGSITVSGGAINDLDLEMGVGQLNLTSALTGDCQLDLGIGESNITLIGSKEDYKLDLEKGLGSISVDGKNVSDYGSSGNGTNEVEINGGVGAINVEFKDAGAL